ncbi:uncharacterized protein LOC106509041 [Sus scrofa]|uniref:uncharacterized protein LOC106509041 n=1 Tax=Sus scrofa TaxID=9823 RepID=UPI000A2AFB7E|nr:uncharacterized protein LOC106509041 [Sus scrofa]
MASLHSPARSARLRAALWRPHASRPRGPSNWLQDERKEGRVGGEGAGPAHPTPPAASAGARPPPARPPRCASRPGGCPWRSSPKRRRAPEVSGSDSGPGPGPRAGARGCSAGSLPEVRRVSPPHLPPPARRRSAHSPNFGPRAAQRSWLVPRWLLELQSSRLCSKKRGREEGLPPGLIIPLLKNFSEAPGLSKRCLHLLGQRCLKPGKFNFFFFFFWAHCYPQQCRDLLIKKKKE